MSEAAAGARPHDFEEIDWLSAHEFRIRWSDGHESRYLLDFLRLNCPCALCQGHEPQHYRALPDEQAMSPNESVPPVTVRPIGQYAMGITFSDGHDTGIHSYRFLRRFCPCETCRPEG